ncbi:glycosyltransferase [Micromonospora sp. NPDC050417]|uniref:glycosyltransferase n=1 Tax=Micromonospora sp. NPDC050417 TaxID=3364280 RepID=UPI0037890B17
MAMRNEVTAMRAAGHEVFVLGFHLGELSADARAVNQDFAGTFVATQRKSLVRATMSNPLLPYQVSSRTADAIGLAQAKAWRPDLVVCHHEWTLPVALQLREELGGVPVILRAHNDELRYYRHLLKAAKGLRAPYLLAEYLRIRRFLGAVADYPIANIWFMSPDDVTPRFAQVPHTIIPPIMYNEPVSEVASSSVGRSRTVTFVGSLDIPHAVTGIEWFLTQTWPKVLRRVPDAHFTLAGRRPGPELVQLAASTPNVTLIPSPEDINEVLAGSRVFVNPIFAGSGVNLKLGDPMRWGIPVVTTTIGARGLSGLYGALQVGDTPETFAERCAVLLGDDRTWQESRNRLLAQRDAYSATSVGALLNASLLDHAVRPGGRRW